MSSQRDYEEFSLLESGVVLSGRKITIFRRNVLTPSSVSKSKPSMHARRKQSKLFQKMVFFVTTFTGTSH
jgi:hypothetical protein